ncbi:MAG: NUDIX domain-containing protein [archaeon]|nr:NUDIX domain-containing protein [archaeon]
MSELKEIFCAVVPMIFNEKKQLLLIKSHKWQDKWICPGGKVLPGEKLEDAVRRETLEELGIKLNEVIYWHMNEHINPPTFFKPAHFLSFVFICKTTDTNVKLNSEAQEFQWISPRQALLLDLDPIAKNTIEIFLRDERYD